MAREALEKGMNFDAERHTAKEFAEMQKIEPCTQTANLIEQRFREGEIAANHDRDKPEGQETECPYTSEIERRWWLRGYRSEERLITVKVIMDRMRADYKR